MLLILTLVCVLAGLCLSGVLLLVYAAYQEVIWKIEDYQQEREFAERREFRERMRRLDHE